MATDRGAYMTKGWGWLDLISIIPLLRIARIEAGGVTANVEKVDLDTLVRDAAELYDAVAEEKQIEFDMKLEAKPHVQGDRDLLFQAIINLLDKLPAHEGSSILVVLNALRLLGYSRP